jgi:hypothetical protein
MSILLKLDSTLNNEGKPDNFTVKFPSPINLSEGYEIALVKLNLWYAWYNISSSKANNTFRYYNGTLYRDVTINDGQYTLEQINNYLHNIMSDFGDFTLDINGQEVYDIIIEPNFSTIRTKLTLNSGYRLDLSSGNLYLLLGGDQIEYNFIGTNDFPFVANINDNINSLVVNCDIISGNFSFSNSNKSNIIYSFVPETAPGTNISIDVINRIYIPIDLNNDQLTEINMSITDNLNRPIDFNDQPVTYILEIRKQQNIIFNKLFDKMTSIFDKLSSVFIK